MLRIRMKQLLTATLATAVLLSGLALDKTIIKGAEVEVTTTPSSVVEVSSSVEADVTVSPIETGVTVEPSADVTVSPIETGVTVEETSADVTVSPIETGETVEPTPDVTISPIETGETVEPTPDVTISPIETGIPVEPTTTEQAQENTVTITIDADGGTWLNEEDRLNYETITITPDADYNNKLAEYMLTGILFKKDGYIQKGWVTDTGRNPFVDGDFTGPDDLVIYPNWVEAVRVTINPDGYEWNPKYGEVFKDLVVEKGSYLDFIYYYNEEVEDPLLPFDGVPHDVILRDGYVITSWVDQDGNAKTPSFIENDVTLTPVWTKTYTYKLGAGAGEWTEEIALDDEERADGYDKQILNENSTYSFSYLRHLMTLDGMVVSSWKDQNGNIYDFDHTFEVTENLVLDAQWVPEEFTLTIDGLDKEYKYISGDKVAYQWVYTDIDDPNTEGKQFVTKYLDADGIEYKAGDTLPDGGLTLYPVWEDYVWVTLDLNLAEIGLNSIDIERLANTYQNILVNSDLNGTISETGILKITAPYEENVFGEESYLATITIEELERVVSSFVKASEEIRGYEFVRLETDSAFLRDAKITEDLTLTATWRKHIAVNEGNDAFVYRGEGDLSWLKVEVDADTFESNDVQVHVDLVDAPEGFEEFVTDAYEIYYTINGERVLPVRPVKITLPHLRDPQTFYGLFRESLDDRVDYEYIGRWAEYVEVLDSVIVSTLVMAYMPLEDDVVPTTTTTTESTDDDDTTTTTVGDDTSSTTTAKEGSPEPTTTAKNGEGDDIVKTGEAFNILPVLLLTTLAGVVILKIRASRKEQD